MGWEQPKKDFKKKNAENAMFEYVSQLQRAKSTLKCCDGFFF